MKSSTVVLALALLGAGASAADPRDLTSEQAEQRAMAEARRRAQEDARRHEEAKQQRGGIMPPVLRWETPSRSETALMEEAAKLEQAGRGAEAVKTYERAARAGNGKAARRLGDIYDKGIAGVARDYALALRWYNAARVLGEDVPPVKR